MVTIEARETKFLERLFLSSGLYAGLVIFIVLEVLLLSKEGLQTYQYLLLQCILFILLLIFFFICYGKARQYINRIEAGDKGIILHVSEFDTEQDPVEIPWTDLRVKYEKSLVAKYPTYSLELSSKTGMVKVKQHQLVYWNRENLEKAYRIIDEARTKLMDS